jgi:hypothetical protein
MENRAIKLLISALEEDKAEAKPGFQVHIAHLADADSLEDINAAKKKGAQPQQPLGRSVLFAIWCLRLFSVGAGGAHDMT